MSLYIKNNTDEKINKHRNDNKQQTVNWNNLVYHGSITVMTIAIQISSDLHQSASINLN